MPTMLQKNPSVKKVLPVIFLLDSSGSMNAIDATTGINPIGALNTSIENLLPELENFNQNNNGVEVRVAVMTFDDEIKWIIGESEPVTPSDARNMWNVIIADGLTSMGEAFTSLNQKLSLGHGFLPKDCTFVAPLLMLFSDGEPTDDVKGALNELRQNDWYKIAARIAVGYGAYCNYKVLKQFTQNSETVFRADSIPALEKFIRLTTLSSIKSNVGAPRGNIGAPGETNVDPDDNTAKAASLIKQQGILDDNNNDAWDKDDTDWGKSKGNWDNFLK